MILGFIYCSNKNSDPNWALLFVWRLFITTHKMFGGNDVAGWRKPVVFSNELYFVCYFGVRCNYCIGQFLGILSKLYIG